MNDAADPCTAVLQQPATPEPFGAQLESWRARMERALAQRLPESHVAPARLHEAMRYSVLGGGKRLRPALREARGLSPEHGCD